MKNLAKIIGIILGSVVILIFLAVLFTQTSVFRNLARDFALKRVNNMLNAKLTVAKLGGNLFNHIELSNVALVQGQDTVAYIGRLDLDFHLLSFLNKEIALKSVAVDSLSAFLMQEPDSSWNFAGLVKVDTLKPPKTNTGKPYNIYVDKFVMKNSRAYVRALDTSNVYIPKRVDNVYLSLSCKWTDLERKLDIKSLSFDASQPDLQLKNLVLESLYKNGRLDISRLDLKTARNEVKGQLTYIKGEKWGNARITTAPMDISEFAFAFPKFKLNVNPALELTAQLSNDSLVSKISLEESNNSAVFDLTAFPYSSTRDTSKIGDVEYLINGVLKNIDMARWTGNKSFAYSVNGKFGLRGKGTTPKTMRSSFDANFNNLRIIGRKVDTARMHFDYDRGNLDGKMILAGAFGEMNFDAIAIDLLGSQRYSLSYKINKLDMAQFLINKSLQSSLNLTILAGGVGFDPSKGHGNISILIDSSRFYDIPLDSGVVRGSYDRGHYIVDSTLVQSPYGRIFINGDLGGADTKGVDYKLEIAEIRRLGKFIKTDTLAGSLLLEGKLNGKIDSLATVGQLFLSHPFYQAITLDTGYVNYSINKIKSDLNGNFKIMLRQFSFGKYGLDSFDGNVGYRDSVISVAANIAKGKSFKASLQSDITMRRGISSIIKYIEIDNKKQVWKGGSDQTVFKINNGIFSLSNFSLVETAGQNKRVDVDGVFSFNGDEDVRLKLSSVDVSNFSNLLNNRYELEGLLSGKMALTGNAANPLIAGNMTIVQGRINNFHFDSLMTMIDYKADRMTWDVQIATQSNGTVTASGFFPLQLAFSSPGSPTRASISNDPMELNLSLKQVPLTLLSAWNTQIEKAKGTINGEFHMKNTLNKPLMSGNMNILNGGFEAPKMGIQYSDIEMGVKFDNNTITLDSLLVSRGKGYMKVTGVAEFDSSLISGMLRRSDFDLQAHNLYLVRRQDLEVEISGNAALKGSSRSPEFSGKITIDRSRIFVPMLSNQAVASAQKFENPPMLIVAARPERLPDSLRGDTVFVVAKSDTSAQMRMAQQVDYFRNLRGTMTIDIPRDTWLRSPDMNIEISGQVQLVKNSPEEFEVFGPIDIVRGKYTLYGRKFKITQGQLTFSGGEQFNPDIDLQADYTFRTPERDKKNLTLHVTGKALTPDLAFNIEGQEVTQSDAVAYIVFGRSMNDVTSSGLAAGHDGHGGGLSGELLAKQVTGKILSGELAKIIGKEFALDVIEVNTSESLQGVTFSVGKYITSNLFMSYQSGLGDATRIDQINAPIITLEYELTKFMSTQLIQGDPEQSGLDLLFKFNIK